MTSAYLRKLAFFHWKDEMRKRKNLRYSRTMINAAGEMLLREAGANRDFRPARPRGLKSAVLYSTGPLIVKRGLCIPVAGVTENEKSERFNI